MTAPGDEVPDRAGRVGSGGRGWFFAVLVAFGALLATWIIGMPRAAPPDEPAHTIKAYATAHGELLGDDLAGASRLDRVMHVPDDLTFAGQVCFAYEPESTAGCVVESTNPALTSQVSGVGTYPPLYYAVVGGVARVAGQADSMRTYRAVSAVFAAVLLALAALFLARIRRGAPVALVLGLTPMAIFMSMAVNPQAIEITGMLLLWAIVAWWLAAPAPPTAAGWLGASILAAVIVAIRPVSLAWVVVAFAAYLVVERRPFADGAGSRLRILVAALAPMAVAVVASAAWSRYAGVGLADERFTLPGGVGDMLRLAIGHTGDLFEQTIGVLGWLDTRMPFLVYALVIVALVAVVLGTLVFGGRRLQIVVFGTIAIWIVYPIVYVVAAGTPLNWQGRYDVPLLGAFVLAATQLLIGPDRLGRRLVRRSLPWVAGGFMVVEVLAFHQALRRFMVGAHGSWLLRGAGWYPSVTAWLLVAVNIVAAVAIGVLLLGSPGRLVRRAPVPQGLATSNPSESATGICAGSSVT